MIADVQSPTPQAPRRGRPRGQFNYHKLVILAFLQAHSPFTGSNDELAAAIGEWGKDTWRVSVSSRQLARYLRALQEETFEVDGTSRPRVEVALKRMKHDGGLVTKRVITANDTRPLNLA